MAEPLIFELDAPNQCGVDLPEPPAHATRLGAVAPRIVHFHAQPHQFAGGHHRLPVDIDDRRDRPIGDPAVDARLRKGKESRGTPTSNSAAGRRFERGTQLEQVGHGVGLSPSQEALDRHKCMERGITGGGVHPRTVHDSEKNVLNEDYVRR